MRRKPAATALTKVARTPPEDPPLSDAFIKASRDTKRFLPFAALRTRWKLALGPPRVAGKPAHDWERLRHEVEARLGVVPHFFASASMTPALAEQLWAHARAAYLDNPLPSLFKERLFVHLSRFCVVRYCIVRHAGFLLGKGRPAGDAVAAPETIEQVLALLGRPVPDTARLEAALARLESLGTPAGIPLPHTRSEEDLFDALTVTFVIPARSAQARAAVRRAVGDLRFEYIMALLAFIRMAHYRTETHPELPYETDMIMLMAQHQDLARRLLDTSDAEWAHAGDAMHEALTGQLQVLNTELQHRTRNLLGVIRVIFDRTLARHSTLPGFSEAFSARLDAIARVQTYLSCLLDGDKVTFDGLLRNELAAHAISLQQITLDGPDGVRLRSSTLQTLALAIHELVVNAVKYGALSSPTAHLSVRWELERNDGKPSLLHVYWQETGVPNIDTAARRPSGYGRELIERALPYQLKATTRYEMLPGEVRCSMSVPVHT